MRRSLLLLLALFGVARPWIHFTRKWSHEIARMNTEDEHLSSSNGPSFVWLDGPELFLRRLDPSGRSGIFCRVRLESSSNSILDIISLPGGTELCSIDNGFDSSSIIAINVNYSCEAIQWQNFHGHKVTGPFFAKRSDGAVDIFYQSNGDRSRPCDAEICRQTYRPGKGTMTPLRPFPLSIRDVDNFEIFNIGSTDTGGYYFFSKHGKLVSVTSEGSVTNTLQIYDRAFELHSWNCNHAHGYFGHCYVDMDRAEKVRCVQTDASLRVLVNATYEFANIAQDLAMQNLHVGGFLLLVNYCSNRCLKYKTHLTWAQPNGPDYGKHVDFVKDENCDDYLRNSFGFFEDGEEICLMSRCYIVPTDYHILDRHNIYVKCLEY